MVWLVTFRLRPVLLSDLLVLIIAALLVLIYGCVQLLILENQKKHQAELRQSILGSTLIPANTFLKNWKTTKSGNKVTGGYKTMDQPGCYVIVTSPLPDGTAFENVYVGQSLHVCSRVRNHLTGHGNGDVYADVRNGKPVFVKIAPCSPQQMNALEKSLIKRSTPPARTTIRQADPGEDDLRVGLWPSRHAVETS